MFLKSDFIFTIIIHNPLLDMFALWASQYILKFGLPHLPRPVIDRGEEKPAVSYLLLLQAKQFAACPCVEL